MGFCNAHSSEEHVAGTALGDEADGGKRGQDEGFLRGARREVSFGFGGRSGGKGWKITR